MNIFSISTGTPLVSVVVRLDRLHLSAAGEDDDGLLEDVASAAWTKQDVLLLEENNK